MINSELILQKLALVSYPGYSRDIVSFGLVKDIQIEEGEVIVKIVIQTTNPEIPETIFKESQRVLSEIPEINHAKIDIEIQNPPNANASQSASSEDAKISGVQKIIAIASGKGGVGKSTLTGNLAIALKKMGKKVGICDCDIYGPSISHLFGDTQSPKINEKEEIIPRKAHGIHFISMGGLVTDESPVIVRGPLATRYIQQFLRQTKWEKLDYLLLDLPPGTGDIQLTIVQTLALDGAIIITTPQELALIDVRKTVSMFKKVKIPLLGIVENMSFLETKEERIYPFGKDGGKREAEKLSLPFLGGIPLESQITEKADEGIPIATTTISVASYFDKIAEKLDKSLEKK